MDKNTIRFDYVDNPDLKELFAGKQPGDTMSVEVSITVAEVTNDYATARVDEISAEMDEEENGSSVAPNEAEPVAVIVMRRGAGMKERGKMHEMMNE